MAIQTEFYNYQQNPEGYNHLEDPWNKCQPAAVGMRRFLEDLDFMYLGCRSSTNRSVRGGTSLSSHTFGVVPDMRYQNPGPGLEFVEEKVIPFLIWCSKETGLQALHHYIKGKIWRPPGTSGRPVNGDGWKNQNVSNPKNNMGKPWAHWLHCEIHPSMLSTDIYPILLELWAEWDGTPVITVPKGDNSSPATDPNITPGVRKTMNVNIPVLKRGSVGQAVESLQALINAIDNNRTIAEDGSFGPETDDAVTDFQIFFGLPHADGIVGHKETWPLLFKLGF